MVNNLYMQKAPTPAKTTTAYLSAITVVGKTMFIGATPDGQLITIIPTPAHERVYGKSSFGSSFKMTFTSVRK